MVYSCQGTVTPAKAGVHGLELLEKIGNLLDTLNCGLQDQAGRWIWDMGWRIQDIDGGILSLPRKRESKTANT